MKSLFNTYIKPGMWFLFLCLVLVFPVFSQQGGPSPAGETPNITPVLSAGTGSQSGIRPFKRFFVKASAVYLRMGDENYREVYASSQFYPQLGVGYRLAKWLYLWADYGFCRASTDIPGTQYRVTAKQSFLSAGLGLQTHLTGRVGVLMQFGLVRFHYQEDAFETEIANTTVGVCFGAGLQYTLSAAFFLEAYLDYSYGESGDYPNRITLGGYQTALGIGFRF